MFCRSVGFFFNLLCSRNTKDVGDLSKFKITFEFDCVSWLENIEEKEVATAEIVNITKRQ